MHAPPPAAAPLDIACARLRAAACSAPMANPTTRPAPAGVLFVDVDGTLVGASGVAPRVWPALERVRAAGWRVALCTGRPGRGQALDFARRVDPDGLHVFESGAAVLTTDGAVVHADALALDVIAAALALGDRFGAVNEVYTADGDYCVRARGPLVAGHEALLAVDARVGPFPTDRTIVRVLWMIEDAADTWPALRDAAATLDADLHTGRSPRMPGVRFVGVTARGVSKASGARHVLDAFGVGPERAAMIGDNLNDLTALRYVGTAFVAADGAPEALALADHVVPGPDAGGVADAVAHLIGPS